MRYSFFAYILIILSSLLFSCSESSNIGADIFASDNLNLSFTDTFGVKALAKNVESYQTLQSGSPTVASGFGGIMTDELFGTTTAEIALNFTIDFSASTIREIADKATIIDSLVLELAYSPRAIYGDTTQEQSFSVYRMTQTLPNEAKSNQKITTNSTPIGTARFIPQPTGDTSTYLNSTFNGSSRLRIKLDKKLIQETLTLDMLSGSGDTIFYSKFENALRGVVLKADRGSNCMLAFDFLRSNGTGNVRSSGMTLHYQVKVEGKDVAKGAKFTAFTWHNYLSINRENTLAEKALQGSNVSDTLLLLQSGAMGNSIQFEFPTIKNLGNALINRAVLDLTIADSYDTTFYKPIPQLFISVPNGSPISDIAVGSQLPFLNFGGGAVRRTVAGKPVIQYALNIPSHLQRIVDGTQSPQIVLTASDPYSSVARSIFYGKKAKDFPLKLRVYYTRL